jgi:hypothetical protein
LLGCGQGETQVSNVQGFSAGDVVRAYDRFMREAGRRSPLKASPLRQAGASIAEEIDRLRDDLISDRLMLAFGAFTVWAVTLVVWVVPVQPGLFFAMTSVVFVGVLAWVIPQVATAKKQIDQLRLGLAGERAVAELLELIAHDGFWVVHDLRGQGFNVDHVIVGTQGVFTIETKTLSKPSAGDARIRFDGVSLTVDSHTLERDPLVQARAQASWLRRTLEELTGRSYPVRPVVVFPGWFVERTVSAAQHDVWVLEPKELRGWLSREPHMLPKHAVGLIRNRLKLVARGGA